MLRRIILPGVFGNVLTGVRLAIGVLWIVLVPCEMLGVSAGLGYYILDTRDRLAWTLRDPRVSSALIGASHPRQIIDNLGALDNLQFSAEELAEIDRFAVEGGINLWEKPSTDWQESP
jgi:hypothetical protein